ncbi:MAG TPA: hydrolase [Usitatibacter sp.]|nr:hydrolase [Usitatibacter sp.]
MAHALKPPPYVAPRWLRNPHLQTVYGSIVAAAPHPRLRRERWETPDGDFVDVDFLDGPAGSPWVQLFHGLEGSSRSPYARMLMAHAARRGWRGAVLNFRGCSGELNRLPRAYHSGDSDEAEWVLRRVKALAGASPLHAVGISLGGNVLAKWLGERGAAARAVVDSAAAVSAPLDLIAAADALERGLARMYAHHFLASLKRHALGKLARFPGLFEAHAVRRSATLRQFDDVVTAPLHGFRDAEDYYRRASAKPLLPGVAVPLLVLNARDDPFLPAQALPTEREVAPVVKLEFPSRGGHVGFVTGPFPGHIEWLPRRLLHFFEYRE